MPPGTSSGLQSPFTPRDHASSVAAPPRALKELDQTEERRNSPAWKQSRNRDENSPNPSPFHTPQKDSPRAFWATKEDQTSSPSLKHSSSVARRASLERLKRASRVQNNKLLNQTTNGVSRPISLPPDHNVLNALRRSRADSTNSSDRSLSTSPVKQIPQTPPRGGLQSIMRGDSTPSRTPGKSSMLSPYRVNDMAAISDEECMSPGRRKGVTFDEEPPQVLQYELVTPDVSVSGSSAVGYDSDESEEEDDEDIENIPVVEPDHGWSNATPENARHSNMANPFTASPTPSPNGGRPLPPLPPGLSRSDSRPLPSVPSAKSTPQEQKRMPLEERLKMVMRGDDARLEKETKLDDSESDTTFRMDIDVTSKEPEETMYEDKYEDKYGKKLQEHKLEKPASLLRLDKLSLDEDKDEQFSEVTFDLPPVLSQLSQDEARKEEERKKRAEMITPRISRESIMRQVEEQRRDGSSMYSFDMHAEEQLYNEAEVKYEEDSEDEIDLYSIPVERPGSRGSVSQSPVNGTVSQASTYETANDELSDDEQEDDKEADAHWNGRSTPTLPTPTKDEFEEDIKKAEIVEPVKQEQTGKLTLNTPTLTSDVLGLGMSDFMCPPTPSVEEPEDAEIPDYLKRPCTPDNQRLPPPTEDEMRTPESVIHHRIEDSEYEETDYEEEETLDEEPEPEPEPVKERTPSPIPERMATIKASGGSKLRTRPSSTPLELAQMAAQRRQVSGTHNIASSPAAPPVPKIPAEYTGEGYGSPSEASDDGEGSSTETEATTPTLERKVSGPKAALPDLGELGLDLGMSDLTAEFDRVIEAQKANDPFYYDYYSSPSGYTSDSNNHRIAHSVSVPSFAAYHLSPNGSNSVRQRGYLMRQNTKVIHATSDDPPTPKGHSRNQSWGSVEPWNSPSAKRKSVGRSPAVKRKETYSKGGVPPLPGQESALASLTEADNESTGRPSTGTEEVAENGERGRLFVKVLGVKDLQLPIPDGESQYFCLTLDNGLHCVTTSWLELGKNAPIGQEFELVVMKDLEFQLTLQTKLEQPPPVKAPATPKQATPKPKSTFSRVFQSPKKRKELERQEQLRLQQQQAVVPPPKVTAWDLLKDVVGRDGSFARSYVCLKDFESRAYGRPYTFEINCFNEWAVDNSTVKRKNGQAAPRKAPYKIGKLEVQMLFIPKPKDAADSEMPKSMSAAIRELKAAESTLSQEWEGHLSQQGGDCPYWRRRYFKLDGSKLTAYHEATRRPRATIDLSKAVKLIYDRTTLTSNDKSSSRRKSGFSEEEEGYMFVEEGFRIRFANGEVIDFYADSTKEKEGWMKVLAECIGKIPEKKGWADIVLSKEAKAREKEAAALAKREKERAEASKQKMEQQENQQRQQQQNRLSYQQQQQNQAQYQQFGSPPNSRPMSMPPPQSPYSSQGNRRSMQMQMGPPPTPPKSVGKRGGIPPPHAFR